MEIDSPKIIVKKIFTSPYLTYKECYNIQNGIETFFESYWERFDYQRRKAKHEGFEALKLNFLPEGIKNIILEYSTYDTEYHIKTIAYISPEHPLWRRRFDKKKKMFTFGSIIPKNKVYVPPK